MRAVESLVLLDKKKSDNSTRSDSFFLILSIAREYGKISIVES